MAAPASAVPGSAAGLRAGAVGSRAAGARSWRAAAELRRRGRCSPAGDSPVMIPRHLVVLVRRDAPRVRLGSTRWRAVSRRAAGAVNRRDLHFGFACVSCPGAVRVGGSGGRVAVRAAGASGEVMIPEGESDGMPVSAGSDDLQVRDHDSSCLDNTIATYLTAFCMSCLKMETCSCAVLPYEIIYISRSPRLETC